MILFFYDKFGKIKLITDKSFFVPVKKIISNDYKLSLNSYLKKETVEKTVKLRELVKNYKIIIGFTPPRDDDSYWFGGKNIWVSIKDMCDDMYISDSEEKITDIGVKPKKLLPIGTLLFSFKFSISGNLR